MVLRMSHEQQYREDLVQFGKLVHQQSFVSACDGNLSVRLDAHRILATPTGVSKGMMHPSDMVIVDMHGKRLAGDRDVSSEIAMHLTIYRTRPDIQSVVHTHPPTATGFASAGIALDQPICSEVVVTLGAVPLAEYGTTGTPELSASLLPYVHDYDAILLSNHGTVSYGTSLMHAYLKTEAGEHFAKIMLVTLQLGQQKSLSQANIRKLVEARRNYKGNNSLASMPVGPLKKPERDLEENLDKLKAILREEDILASRKR